MKMHSLNACQIVPLLSVLALCLQIEFVRAYAKHIEHFSHPDIQHYKQLLFDVQNVKLLVGARDYIVTLGLEELDAPYKRVYYIPSDQSKQRTCEIKGMKKEQCHNFITALLPISTSNYANKQILVCGTNAYSPECEIRPLASLDTITSRSAPINSYSPLWNTTSLITSTGEFFYGGPLDFRGIDSSITRQQITLTSSPKTTNVKDKRIIRSAQHDSKWINSDANFVHSFEYESHVYFLFRESAVEYLNCGKRTYSRIGRVCKNDPGMRENWTSFLKTRLNCSIPGLFPFYFDEIQSVDWIEGTGSPTLYAIFNTPENSIHGSAVCAFNIKSIISAFQGSFKIQKSSNHIWESVNDKRDAFECGTSASNYSESYNHLPLNSIYQLMDNSVQAINDKPYVISKNQHFKLIAVDVIKTKHFDSVEILFIATRDGKLLKYVQWPQLTESCLVDEIQLINPKNDQFLSMKFLRDTQSLYFGTEKEVLRVSVHRCGIYHTKEKCISSGDPYCGWSENKMKCTKAPGNNVKSETWIQSKTPQCMSDPWDKWFDCKQFNKSSEESCKCRKRPCSSESDQCVDGYEVQVSNCTQNGGWSEWSPWSVCTPSCGKGAQYRTRTCTNPVPQFNGQPCEGPNREVRDCADLPYCSWSSWSTWSNCSNVCGPEFEWKRRARKCVDFQGNQMDESFCSGVNTETAMCDNCKKSEWSDWFMTEINGNEVIEQRNELLSHESSISAKNEKRVISLKYCDKCNGYTYKFKERDFLLQECSCDGNQEWSDWSEWSMCVNGTQNRLRNCLLIDRLCSGHHQETRYCSAKMIHLNNPNMNHLSTSSSSSTTTFVLLICVILSVCISSCLTWYISVVMQRRKEEKANLGIMNHTNVSEPNTYEEVDKYRYDHVTVPLNGNTTLTKNEKFGTLKREFSFKANLQDDQYY